MSGTVSTSWPLSNPEARGGRLRAPAAQRIPRAAIDLRQQLEACAAGGAIELIQQREQPLHGHKVIDRDAQLHLVTGGNAHTARLAFAGRGPQPPALTQQFRPGLGEW